MSVKTKELYFKVHLNPGYPKQYAHFRMARWRRFDGNDDPTLRVEYLSCDLCHANYSYKMISYNLCKLSRNENICRNLEIAKSQSRNGLEILANHRNKIFLRRLKSCLKTVKTLYETEFQLKDFIQVRLFAIDSVNYFFHLPFTVKSLL